jgi:hypothetical protein
MEAMAVIVQVVAAKRLNYIVLSGAAKLGPPLSYFIATSSRPVPAAGSRHSLSEVVHVHTQFPVNISELRPTIMDEKWPDTTSKSWIVTYGGIMTSLIVRSSIP